MGNARMWGVSYPNVFPKISPSLSTALRVKIYRLPLDCPSHPPHHLLPIWSLTIDRRYVSIWPRLPSLRKQAKYTATAMASWLDLPFEVKSLISQHYIKNAEAEWVSRIDQGESTPYVTMVCGQEIDCIINSAPEMEAEIVRRLEQSPQKHNALSARALRAWKARKQARGTRHGKL